MESKEIFNTVACMMIADKMQNLVYQMQSIKDFCEEYQIERDVDSVGELAKELEAFRKWLY